MSSEEDGLGDGRVRDLEARLNDADPAVRRAALQGMADRVERGEVELLSLRGAVSLHCRTSYSGKGAAYSPAALAWAAKKNGLAAVGVVDVATLDGYRLSLFDERRLPARPPALTASPNPFRSATVIHLGTGQLGHSTTSAEVFDASGRLVLGHRLHTGRNQGQRH